MKNIKMLYVLFSVVTANIVANSVFEETKQAYITFAQNCDQSNWSRFSSAARRIQRNNSRNLTIEEDLTIHLITLDELRKKDECLRIFNLMQKQLTKKQSSLYKYSKKSDTLHDAKILNLEHNPAYAEYRKIHCKGCVKKDYEKLEEKLSELANAADLAIINDEPDAYKKIIEVVNLCDQIGIS